MKAGSSSGEQQTVVIEAKEGLNHLFQHCTTGEQGEYKEIEEQYIYDENGMLEFGFECTIPTSLFMEDSELKTHVIPVIGKEEETLWSSFQKLKELYIEVSEEQEIYKFIEYDLFYGKGKNE